MRAISVLMVSLLVMLARGAVADEPEVDGGAARATFDAEICKVDGLSAAQCECAWKFMAAKLSAGDLKLAMLLTASSSDDADTARKADAALDKSNSTDKRRDALASETSALVIEAEDSCAK